MAEFTVRDVAPAHKRIMAAMAAGRIGPRGAVTWARRAARGEPIDLLDHLAGVDSLRASAEVMAHSHQQVMDILTRALLGEDDGHQAEDDDSLTEHGDGLAGSGPISDDEADLLFPPRTPADADRQAAIRREGRQLRAAALEPWGDEALHAALFGDSSYEPGDHP